MGVWEVKQRDSPFKKVPTQGYVAGGATVHARTARLFAIRPDAREVFKVQVMDHGSQSHTPTNSGSSGAAAPYHPAIWPTAPSDSDHLAMTVESVVSKQKFTAKLSKVRLFEDRERRLREFPVCFPHEARELSVRDMARRYFLCCEEPLPVVVERAWKFQCGIAKDILAVWLLSVLDSRHNDFSFTTECGFMFALLQNTPSSEQRKWIALLAERPRRCVLGRIA